MSELSEASRKVGNRFGTGLAIGLACLAIALVAVTQIEAIGSTLRASIVLGAVAAIAGLSVSALIIVSILLRIEKQRAEVELNTLAELREQNERMLSSLRARLTSTSE